jgi:predicted phage terminase large subunit-like protein
LIPFARATLRGYKPGRAQRYLASVLEKVERGEIKRLMVWWPPRHGKTELATKRFPAWYLGRHPDEQVIITSYGADLAADFSGEIRETVNSKVYGDIFPGLKLRSDDRARNKWRLAGSRGGLSSAGVAGVLTGKGANLLIIDDPVKNDKEANSAARRESLKQWFASTAFTRLEPDARVIIIQTRWHKDDLSGWLEECAKAGIGDEWVILNLPAIAEDNEDWGEFGFRLKGEALWPEKYNLSALEQIRAVIGEYWFGALYQQRPRILDGNLLDSRKFWKMTRKDVPPLVKTCRYWDLAFSEKEGADRASGVLCGIDALGRFYILDVIRTREPWPRLSKLIERTSDADGPTVPVIIEANGTQLGYYQEIKDRLKMRRVVKGVPDGSKYMRAALWGSRLEDGIIIAVLGVWNNDFFEECDGFPHSGVDDQIDGVSGSWAFLVGNRVTTGGD